MDVIIQSLGFTAGEQLEAFAREKLSKLKPSDHIIRANVTLFLGPESESSSNYCEIILEVPGNDLFVKESSPEFEQAITQAVNKLQQVLRKEKDKMIDRNQGK